MIEQGMIQRINTEYYDKIQARYIPLAKADLTELKTSEKDVIDKVIEQMSQLFYFFLVYKPQTDQWQEK